MRPDLQHFNNGLPLLLQPHLHVDWLAYISMVTSDVVGEERAMSLQTHLELLKNYCVLVLRSDAECLQRAVEDYAAALLDRRTGTTA